MAVPFAVAHKLDLTDDYRTLVKRADLDVIAVGPRSTAISAICSYRWRAAQPGRGTHRLADIRGPVEDFVSAEIDFVGGARGRITCPTTLPL
jgi:hypothetical protein